MTTHYDNSGSEDGQLRSPGDYQFISGDDELDEHDGDSLDIKPPQAIQHYSRDVAVREPKRHDKISKEKKHSKERRQHRDKSGSAIGSSGGGSDGGHERERERKPIAAPFREARTEIERYQQRGGGGGGGGYERNDGARYQKHYDRGRDNHALLHHHNQQSAPMHMHRRQQDYFERPNDYHHHHGNDYHSMRQAYNNKHYGQRVDYGHDLMEPVTTSNIQREREREREKERDRRKYSNSDGQQDAESLEQDLRSRLLSKRHKYVKEYEPASRKHHIEIQDTQIYEEKERTERSYDEAHKERHSKSKRVKETRSKVVIEVFDSPDVTDLTYEKTKTQSQQHNKKHKRRDKDSKLPEAQSAAINVVEKHRSPEDSELVTRRSKFLVAEREKAKRKEQARDELEARREKRRERGAAEVIDELSPTAVAATVTAGLSALVKRHKSGTTEKRKKQSKKHKSKQHSDYEEGEHEEDQHEEEEDDDKDNDYDDSETDEQSEAESEHKVKMGKRRKNSVETLQHVKRKKLKNSKHQNDEQRTDDEDVEMEATNSHSDSDAASERSYKKSKAKRKHSKKFADQSKKHRSKKHADPEEAEDDDGDEVLKLPDSPLSIGELSKSPEKRRGRAKNLANDGNDDDDDDDVDDDADERTHSTRSRSHTRSRTESRSRSHTPHSSTHSSSRSRSRSRSLSHRRRRTISSSRSDSRSRSPRSRSSRSRSRTEERDMQANLRKSDAIEQQQHHLADAEKRKTASTASSPTPCDDKGTPLPNYFPGLQGCRSVEEFQCLNRIEEGTYGVVYRAKDKRTHEIVALKRLKMEKEKEGFPITSLREINTLLKGQHPNIVTVREIVVGSNMDKIFIVMDYVEHDLKSLMETMKTRKQCFLPGEVKCLTQQLLNAVGHLHDNWILHRDLKTSNLLLSHKGILKVGDFGLAREYGSPLKKYTSLVVTLWYRAPELLLCSPEYSTPVDIWSVGCIFAEFLQMAPLFPGKSEIDELNRIFKELGTPNDKIWPGYKDLPAVKNLLSQNSQFADYPVSNLRKRFHEKASDTGIALLHGLLTYDPKQRLTADAALKHAYFKELPLPIDPSMFPTWPAKSELGARKALASSPKPPSGGSQFKQLGRDEPISNTTSAANKSNSSTGFSGIITGNKKKTANTGFVLNAGIEQRQVAMGPGFNLKF